MNVWIKAEDKMPPVGKDVLVLYKYRTADTTKKNLKYGIAQRVIDTITGEERWSYFIDGSLYYKIVYWTWLIDMPKILMCKWCDTKLYEPQYYGYTDFDMEQEISKGDLTTLYMLWNSKTGKFGMYASGEGEAVININFCPNCGRKLT